MSVILDLIRAFEKNQTLHAACELKLFDIIAEGGENVDIDTLGQEVGCQGSTDRLERFCNLCCSIGLLEKSSSDGKASYSNSKDSQTWLVSSSPMSQQGHIMCQKTMHFTCLRYDSIAHSIIAGKARDIFMSEDDGESGFDEMYKDREKFFAFGAFMDSVGMTLRDDLKTLDLGKYKHVVDLGGCLGAVARCMKQNYPDMLVTLADLEAPINFAPEFPQNNGVDMKYEAVDFFKGGLPSADLYMLGHILHDWDDERCLEILANVKKGLQPGGAVLILDCLLDDDRTGPTKTCEVDLHMLALLGGRERTGREFKSMLEKSGFRDVKLHPLDDNYWYDAVIAYV